MAVRRDPEATAARDMPIRIEFGSNTVTTSARAITVDGRRMWSVDNDGHGRPHLRSPIFDATGQLIASITNDGIHGPDADRFRLEVGTDRWEVWDGRLGKHVFVASLDQVGALVVERADFFGVNGSHVVVMDGLVVYTHCPAAPERLEIDLRNIFLLADQQVESADGVVLGAEGFAS